MAAMNTTPGHKYILCTEKKKVYAAPKERAVGQLAVGWELQERH